MLAVGLQLILRTIGDKDRWTEEFSHKESEPKRGIESFPTNHGKMNEDNQEELRDSMRRCYVLRIRDNMLHLLGRRCHNSSVTKGIKG